LVINRQISPFRALRHFDQQTISAQNFIMTSRLITDYFNFEDALGDAHARSSFQTYLKKDAKYLLSFLNDYDELIEVNTRTDGDIHENNRRYSWKDDLRIKVEELIRCYLLQGNRLSLERTMRENTVAAFNKGENVLRLLEAIALDVHAKLRVLFHVWLQSEHFEKFLACVVLDRQSAAAPVPPPKLFRKKSSQQIDLKGSSLTEMNLTILALRSQVEELEEEVTRLRAATLQEKVSNV
jgi:hypothetical protein